MRRVALVAVCAVAAWSGFVGGARAQTADGVEPPPERVPRAAARVVARFDFDEPDNPLPVPRGWARGQSDPTAGIDRPGFPVWNGATLDTTEPTPGGAGSVRVPVSGGSASLRLTPGIVPIFPSADYSVSALVKTSPTMRHARAVLVARQLDDRGLAIPGTEARSDPVATFGAWKRVSVRVLAEDPEAAFLQVELFVLQPEQLAAGAPKKAFSVWPQDFDAAAWFDDVVIAQRPRLILTTEEPGNIVEAPGRPVLSVGVRDLAGEVLSVRMAVYDIDGRALARRGVELASGRYQTTWEPDLPAYGWYRATLEVGSGTAPPARETCDFLWVPPGDAIGAVASEGDGWGDRRRFGVHAGAMPEEMRAQIPAIVETIGVGSVTLPVWAGAPRGTPAETIAALAPVIDGLRTADRDVVLAITELPTALAAEAGVAPSDVARVFGADRAVWGPELDPLLDRFGQRVRRWQIGAPESGWGMGERTFAADLDRVNRSLGVLVPGPVVGVPWASENEPSPALVAGSHTTVLAVDDGLGDEGLAQIVDGWLAAAAGAARSTGARRDLPELALVMNAPRVGPHGRGGADAFARRAVAAWDALNPEGDGDAAARTRIDIARAWSVRGVRRPKIEPTPALGVWRTLVRALAGRTVVTELDMGPGVRGRLLEPGANASESRGSALMVWRVPGSGDGVIEMFMGDGDVRAVDLFGNEREVPQVRTGDLALPAHRVGLSEGPVIIEGVDPAMVRFLTGVRLDPGLIVSEPGVLAHDLVVTNPWAFTIRGRLYVLEPGGHSAGGTPVDRSWEISPRVRDFMIGPGETARLPVSLAFGAAQRTGTRDLVVDFELGSGASRTLRAKRTVELGLADVRMDVYERAGAAPGDDVVIHAEVTNLSASPIAVDLVGVAPGQAKARASITTIAPGQTVIRVIAFFDARDEIGGHDAIIGLSMPEQPGRLNTVVRVARRRP
ncbi:MAG: hypothetical protein DHS20C14_16190 [Phycisphaeraceae bacterium]|nr:MAG: hypothetical protein DHS20C14_16190 [Phycisphaeraceae bacterium]